jgi:hypothetical protein
MTYCIVYSPLGHFEWKSATGGNDSDEGHLNNVILRRWWLRSIFIESKMCVYSKFHHSSKCLRGGTQKKPEFCNKKLCIYF